MARIPQEDLDRIKSQIDLAALVRAKGVELKPHGAADLIGRCPFHNDKTPSLVVTPEKGLWHCLGACQVGGSVVDWVMKTEGVSFRHAATILQEGKAATLLSGDKIVSQSRARKLASPLTLAADDQALLDQVTAYYHETLKKSPKALEYLRHRGLEHAEAIETFKLGYADRTLGLRLPEKTRKEGEALRTRLTALGVYRESGHEHLSGSLIIPLLDAESHTRNLYGRKVLDNLRAGTAYHLYLPGPHRGVFNPDALREREIILCESLIDALSFWVNGFKNVTTAYGVEGFTEEMLSAYLQHGVKRVLIAYDRDEAGDRAAVKLADKLMGEGLECLRVLFPQGMDANEYIQRMKPAEKSLRALLQGAEWMGKRLETLALPSGERVDTETGEVLGVVPADLLARVQARYPHLQAAQQTLIAGMWERRRNSLGPDTPLPPYPVADESAAFPSSSLATTPLASPVDQGPEPEAHAEPVNAPAGPHMPTLPHTLQGEDVHVTLGDRAWRVRGLARNISYEVLKVNLRVLVGGAFYLDTLDFYSAKGREVFAARAAAEVKRDADILKRDLGRLLNFLEALQAERIPALLKPKAAAYTMTQEEEEEALALARAPDLPARLIEDLTACGYLGEDIAKLTAYIAATSRKLSDPLSIIIQSSSASGKSSLMDAVLSLIPAEDKLELSALTGQALFYMEKDALRHKLLSVSEDGGMAEAGYALKNLITDKKLVKASPGKDPQTGKMVTQRYEAEGPTAVIVSSTAAEIEPELQNRCLILTLCEDKAQTEAILSQQRYLETLEGKKEKKKREVVRRRHHNFQRLLRHLEVVNPFAPFLRFSAEQSRLRRDQTKYLGLMRALALLNQHQRPLRQDGDMGEYVEVTLADVATANRLCAEVLGRTLDELAPQTRRLLILLTDLNQRLATEGPLDIAQVRFTRWDIRKATGWGHSQLAVHLTRLVALEYLIVHRGRSGLFEYELLYRGEGDDGGAFVLGLIDVEELQKKMNGHAYDSQVPGVNATRPGGFRGGSGRVPAPFREGGRTLSPNHGKGQREGNVLIPENAYGSRASASHRNGKETAHPLVAPLAAIGGV